MRRCFGETKMAINTEKVKNCVKTYSLTVFTLIGVLGGVALGFGLRTIDRERWWTKREVMYVQFVGDVYLRMLNGLILPFMVSAIVSAVGSLELKTSWRIGLRSVAWLILVQFIAVVEGIILAVAIQPGSDTSVSFMQSLNETKNVLVIDTILDIFRNLYPPNLVEASLSQYRTRLIPPPNVENDSIPLEEWVISKENYDNTNILGVINFSVFLALAVGIMSQNSKPIVDFFAVLEKSMMMAVSWVLLFSPVGVFFLIAAKLIETEDLAALFQQLGLYAMTVLIGLFIHAAIVLPVLFFILTRKSPFKFIGNMSQATITAFGTASSAITMPISMDCLERLNKLEERIVRFTIPIGTTLNMDGTALYEAVAVIFLAQMRGAANFGLIVLVCITVTAACLGGAGIPQGGLVIMVMILNSLGLPAEDVGLIIAIDWLLDRFRTTVNVLSDALGTGVIDHYSKEEVTRLNKKYAPLAQDEIELTMRE